VVELAKRWGVWIAVLGLSAIGYLFRDYVSGNVGQLRVGDCFDVPAGLVDQSIVKEVQHHPCTSTHGAEVVFVGTVSGSDDVYPGVDVFDAYVQGECLPAFRSYTGRDFDTDEVFDMSYVHPTPDGWTDGDHVVTCFVFRIDNLSMTTSVKAAR
jgi:hypothetical protein